MEAKERFEAIRNAMEQLANVSGTEFVCIRVRLSADEIKQLGEQISEQANIEVYPMDGEEDWVELAYNFDA